MKSIMVLIGVGLLSSVTAFGMTPIQTEIKEQIFKATVQTGFHFNEKAPNVIVIDDVAMKPTKLEAHDLEFTNLPKTWAKGYALLYTCDDAVTFCEPHRISLKGEEKPKAGTPKIVKISRVNKHGFIEDDFARALETAKKKKQLLLIDFSARWCPGCVRLETETFGTKPFQKATKDFVKLHIDVDRFENNVLSEKFNIRGIPALLIVNAEQEEIDRILDYQPMDRLQIFFSSVQSDPTPVEKLIETARSGDPKIIQRVGLRLLASGRAKESLPFLSQMNPPPPELAFAKVESASTDYKKDQTKKSLYVATLNEAIASEPESSRSISWRTELVGLLEDKATIKKIMEDGLVARDVMLNDAKKLSDGVKNDLVGEFTGFESLMVAMNSADLVESAGAGPEQVILAWNKAVEVGKKLKISPQHFGPALRYLIVLMGAKHFEDADKLASGLLKADPGNGDVQRRRIKILVALKKFPEAIRLGQKALKNSYGRNEYWVVESLTKAYLGAQKSKEAKELLDAYLSRSDVDWPTLQSSKKSLEELRNQIAKKE